jgi:rod shape-determining protein MreD
MNPTLARSVVFLRAVVPVGTLVLAVALTAVPYGIPFLGPVTPFFALIAIFYWSIHRPEQIPAVAIFMVGVLQDLITGGPPGSIALLLLLVHALAVSQQRILLGQSYLVEWAGFALVALGAAAVGWLLACVYNTALILPWHFLVQALLTVALYPAATTVLTPAAKWSRAAEPA